MIEAAISTIFMIMSTLILFESVNRIKPRIIILRGFLGFILIWTISFTSFVVFSNMLLVFYLIFIGKIYHRTSNFWHLIFGPFLSVMITSILNFILYYVISVYFGFSSDLALSSILTFMICVLLSRMEKFKSLYYIDLNPLFISVVVIGILILFSFLQSVSSNNLIIFYLVNFLILLLLVYNIATYFEEKRNYKESYEMQIQYSKRLEELNEELSAFKHDYINLLLTIKRSIDNNNLEETKEIFYKTILPSKEIILDTDSNLERYKHLKIAPLKNLILSKEIEANQQGVKIDFLLLGILDKVDIPIIDLIRIVSILLDNAIQAAQQSKEEKRISICIAKLDNEITISVSNSTKNLEFDRTKIFEKKYSTTNNKDRGIGLFSLERIVNRHPSVNLVTEFKENSIVQSIIISNRTEAQ